MKDILLINPPPVVLKEMFAEDIMYSNPPIGLGYLASVLRNDGYSVEICDMGPQKLRVKDVINRVDGQYSAVGITSMVANHGNCMRLAKALKESFPEIKVIFGGPQASFIPEEILKSGYVDIVCMLEGEETIIDLMNTLSKNDGLEKVNGIAYAENGKIHINAKRTFISELDKIPFPAWDLFSLKDYIEPGLILSGRGCPYQCIFCAASAFSGAKYRMRSPGNVVDEIEYIHTQYGINYMFIADDTFTAVKKHALDICSEIKRRKLDISWEAEVRANTIDDEIAKEMAKAGCVHVQIGAESGDNGILKKVKKNITTHTIENAVKIMLKNGISVVCSFIIGHPFDTYESVQRTIAFAVKLRKLSQFSTCKFALLTPLPGTPIFEEKEKYGIKLLTNNWDQYTFHDPVFETKSLSKKELQNLFVEVWMEYGLVDGSVKRWKENG